MLSSPGDTDYSATLRGRILQLIIHKGSQEIGGTCIQLSQDGTTILLDLGLPLREESKPVDLSTLDPDAIFVSHPHQDHYGLIVDANPSIPIYMSELGKRLIDAARIFSHQAPLSNDFHFFKPWIPLDIGPFKITPYLMDHSSPDAFAFLVEAYGERVFYTGDLRAHGRKGVLFERLVDNPPPDIDVLIMEGTMLERTSDDYPTESAVEEKIVEIIEAQNNTAFIISSSQNIDRLVSAVRACKRTGKTLVVDAYTAWVLEQMKLVSEKVPSMSWKEVKVIIPNSQYQVMKANRDIFGDFKADVFDVDNRIELAEIMAKPANYLQTIRLSGSRFIVPYLEEKPVNVIYSQWLGYLEGDKAQFGAEVLGRLRDDPRVNFVYAHTTGHALLNDLKRVSNALRPKMLVPIHTDHPEEFEDHFQNVFILEDGKKFTVPDSTAKGVNK